MPPHVPTDWHVGANAHCPMSRGRAHCAAACRCAFPLNKLRWLAWLAGRGMCFATPDDQLPHGRSTPR